MLRREPQEQAGRAVSARARKRDHKNIETSVALEAKALGKTELKIQLPSWLTVVVTAILRKSKNSEAFGGLYYCDLVFSSASTGPHEVL
jgi:hypothetical protein